MSEKTRSTCWWAVERFMHFPDLGHAEDAWIAILEIVARKPPAQVISMLAAGPLEDLINKWGASFIERIELKARQEPDFRHVLGGVWQCRSPEVWARISRLRGTPW